MSRKLFVIPALVSASIAAAVGSVSQAQAQIDPYLGQLMMTSVGFCPRGFVQASGQLLAINSNQALFSILGTTYGGNGTTNFQLPNMNARSPIGPGQAPGLSSYSLGQPGGQVGFTLLTSNMPAHNHAVKATNVLADRSGPANKYIGLSLDKQFHNGPANINMAADMLTAAGSNQAVSYRTPYLAVKWCIALQGIFPSRN